MARKILVALTSHDKLGDTGRRTACSYQSPSPHTWECFHKASAEVVVALPAGGVAPVNPNSVEYAKGDPASVAFFAEYKALREDSANISLLLGRAGEFDAVFFPGGHGPMFDLAFDADSQRLVAEFWEKSKVVAAVYYGPAALVNVKLAEESLLLQGKTFTGFSNEEEDFAELSEAAPFLRETKLNESSGGKYVKADKIFVEKVVVDGKLITRQNFASAKTVGEAIIKALALQATCQGFTATVGYNLGQYQVNISIQFH